MRPNDQLWQIPVCLKGSASRQPKCELMTKKEETFTLPGCSTWVLGNAGATGYYRVGYQPEAVRALASRCRNQTDSRASASLCKMISGLRYALGVNRWATTWRSRRVCRPTAIAPCWKTCWDGSTISANIWSPTAIAIPIASGCGNFWPRPAKKSAGNPSRAKATSSETLRVRVLNAMGYDARDPQVLAEARKIADKSLADPSSVDQRIGGRRSGSGGAERRSGILRPDDGGVEESEIAGGILRYLYTLPEFTRSKAPAAHAGLCALSRCAFAGRFATDHQCDGKSGGRATGLGLHSSALDRVEKAGGPFASARSRRSNQRLLRRGMRDQVTEFFTAHKVAAAERTYKQSIERINNCVDLKSQQETQLASWLGQHGTAGGK